MLIEVLPNFAMATRKHRNDAVSNTKPFGGKQGALIVATHLPTKHRTLHKVAEFLDAYSARIRPRKAFTWAQMSN